MGDENQHDEVVPVFGERRFLYPAEIAALFWKLQQPHNEEAQRIARAQLDAATQANAALFLLTGNGEVKGQLPAILEQLAEGKARDERMALRQKKIMRRVVTLEQQREKDHTQNRLSFELQTVKQDKAIAMLRRDLRAIRRSQLWVVRYSRGFYDWCTSKDDKGRYSRARVATFLTFLATAEEAMRHLVPLILHKIAAFFHTARL